ncbi:MAG TPA: hypothetical protein VFR87_08225 [Nocardioidaceae bacterium]|nr:hypothetical protein [Nocardioidaceae bacterium]
MTKRLQTLGIVLAVLGLGFLVGSGIAYAKVADGQDSLQAFSAAQNVELTYNEDGELTDRGETEGAQAIMQLLTEDWQYPVVDSELDPDDPLVNTASEYMYQMATIAFHTLHGTQTVVLEEDVEYNGELFEAGTYEVDVDGRYWTDFDREHPIDGVVRGQAWSGTAHGLIAELGVGTVTAQALTMGLALTGLLAGVGASFLLLGLGLVWVGKTKTAPTGVPAAERIEAPSARV